MILTTKGEDMQAIGNKVLLLKQASEYSGLIQGVADNNSTQAKVMSIGSLVKDVVLGDIVIANWKAATNVGGDLWIIEESEIVAVLEGTAE